MCKTNVLATIYLHLLVAFQYVVEDDSCSLRSKPVRGRVAS